MNKQHYNNVTKASSDSMTRSEILIHVLDRTRELQVLTSTEKLEMLSYLLTMVEHEAETMLMDDNESDSDIGVRQSGDVAD